jgi:hypothetical protein
VGVGGVASASAPDASTAGAAPASAAKCTWTVTHPSYVFAKPDFGSTKLRGKHTGTRITSAQKCATFDDNGFTSIRISDGRTGWAYAGDIAHPAPPPPGVTSYEVYVRAAAVRTAPSATRGKVIKVKPRFSSVSSPNPVGVGVNGYIAVNLSKGDLGWFPADDLLQ